MDEKMEKKREYRSENVFQTGDVYFEYLKEMKKDNTEDSDYSTSFMTF
jgi:hypothetical protein